MYYVGSFVIITEITMIHLKDTGLVKYLNPLMYVVVIHPNSHLWVYTNQKTRCGTDALVSVFRRLLDSLIIILAVLLFQNKEHDK